MRRIKNIPIYFSLFFLISFLGKSQTLSSSLDKKSLTIGEVAIFKIQILNLDGKDVHIAAKNEMLPFHFEVINDSIAIHNDVYLRSVKFAIYQEGKFTIPEIEVRVNDKILKTIPYDVEVNFKAHKDDQINDIMKNKEVRLNFNDYWEMYKFYMLLVLLIIAIIIFIIGIIKWSRKSKDSPVVATNQTLKDLEKLRKKNYIEEKDFRTFYVELIEISRSFMTKQYKFPADVLLTDDLIAFMKTTNAISAENEKIVEDIFVRGDSVKFAKIIPNQETMKKDLEDIIDFVKRSKNDVEAENIRSLNSGEQENYRNKNI